MTALVGDGKPEPEKTSDDKAEPEKSGDGKPEPEKTSDNKKQEEARPRPATYAKQLHKSLIHRLMEAGHPTCMLTQNFRQHGQAGDFFNRQLYRRCLTFKRIRDSFNPADQATGDWLRKLANKDTIKGNTLMIDMHTLESCVARSFSNVANVNFTLSSLVDLLADPRFAPTRARPNDGKVMVIAPYDAQRTLYTHELQRRADQELNSKGEWVKFDKSRIDIRTHQGAQGHEATLVITDLTRSESAGMTGGSELVNACSSRAISAQVVLINRSVIDRAASKVAPSVRNLVSWAEFHESNGMLIELDITTAKSLRMLCWKCYVVGHKGSECPFIYTNDKLICPKPGCGGDHHPRDCYRSKGRRARVKAAEDDTKSATSSKPGEASQSAAAATTRSSRSEREAVRPGQ